MDPPERHRRAKELFLAAAELAPERRESFLDEACAGDLELLAEVRALLAGDDEQDFLETPAAVGLGLVAAGPKLEIVEDEAPVEGWERYEVLERLGGGGMGEVYKAYDPRLKRQVALKFLRSAEGRNLRRFLREAEAQARVEHEHVLKVYETGEVEGRPYIAMQFVDGPTLSRVAAETSLEERLSLLVEIAEAVDAAHRQGLVHRDLKPGNILVERTPTGLKPYVMDFGIATILEAEGITVTGEILGTPWYMAPEQVGGGGADVRSDVYGLGATSYELLSGRRPYPASNPLEMLRELEKGEPIPLRQVAPGIPDDLATIVMHCLEREPERRYPTAEALAGDLRRFLAREPISARPASLSYRLLKKTAKHRRGLLAGLVAAALIATMAAISLRTLGEARRREALASELGRRVEEMEYPMRVARLAPRHDVVREEQLVRERMAAIRDRLAASGLLGEGSGHYALGRGYLALGEYQRAREALERAWAYGYQTAATAFALGRTLGELYQRRLADALLEPDSERRAERQAELTRSLRDPALAYLQRATGGGAESPDYLAALIAFYSGRLDEATRLARAAYQRLPWLHQAMRLEGDVETARLVAEATTSGDPSAITTAYERARAAYERALETAPSAVANELALARLERLMLARDRKSVREHAERGEQACAAALTIEPGRAETERLRGELALGLAESLIEAGEDPRPALERALATLERALELTPVDAVAELALGDVHRLLARDLATRGADSTPALERARAAFERALELDPRSRQAANRLEDLESAREGAER